MLRRTFLASLSGAALASPSAAATRLGYDTYTLRNFKWKALQHLEYAASQKLPMATLIGGLTGMATGFALQYWAAVLEYPMNIGGRPFASWPSFVVPSYELTILFSALTATLFMIIANGLPQPYHPVFNVPRFSMASSDKFFLVIEAEDPRFEATGTSQFLQTLGARGIYDVPA